jgi:hypothetical protein
MGIFFLGVPPSPGGGYFGDKSFILLDLVAVMACKILKINWLPAKYYKQRRSSVTAGQLKEYEAILRTKFVKWHYLFYYSAVFFSGLSLADFL